ncbi:exonuclease domain-containing protein [Bacillus salipaludis]|uniref:Exonuclease domain-containing protein n=1 Tax=Bacillus salipaludis TaxID=2547811 RepID=A0AA90QW25_9BACI|nr:exonuclease domain-containing protein [Bacillus salipaludis]MDQ6595927.1 exonuclease domain-containing protein [Bacillus salipaludis]
MNEMIQYFKQISGKLGSNLYTGFQDTHNLQQLSFIRNLQKEMKDTKVLDVPLHELNFTVFDLETSGFFPEKGDRILSIGAVKMKGTTIISDQTFYALLKSEHPISDEISLLTKIQTDELHNAPDGKEVLLQFYQFIKKDILVAHHSKHEKAFMQKSCWDHLKIRFVHRIIDTSFLIRLSNPQWKSFSLDDTCQKCGIEIKNRHHALGDAMMTAQIWGYYLNKAQEMGFKNLREVYEYLAKSYN